MAERTVVVSSLSKSHAMPGFRFGWIVGPPALSAHLFELLVAMIYGSPAFIQDGVMPALEADLLEIAAHREVYHHLAAMLSVILSEATNCRMMRPDGGIVVMIDT